jgi:hypothetical protein
MENVSKSRLEKLLLVELRQVESDVGPNASIGFYDVVEPDQPNWSVGVCNFDGGDTRSCVAALQPIVARFLRTHRIG